MICTNENDILFDDVEVLENILGENSLNVSSVNANCDCTSYNPTFDEDFDTEESAAVAAANS